MAMWPSHSWHLKTGIKNPRRALHSWQLWRGLIPLPGLRLSPTLKTNSMVFLPELDDGENVRETSILHLVLKKLWFPLDWHSWIPWLIRSRVHRNSCPASQSRSRISPGHWDHRFSYWCYSQGMDGLLGVAGMMKLLVISSDDWDHSRKFPA